MAQITYYLNTQKKNKKNECPILMFITFHSDRIKKSTREKCLEKHWNEKNQKVKPNLKSEEENHHEVINLKLDKLKRQAQDIVNHASINDIPLTKKYFESEWDNKLISRKGKSLLDYFDRFIEIEKTIKAERTIKGYTTAYNFIQEFSNTHKTQITLENLDLDTFEKLRDYAFNVKDLSDNSFATTIRKIKTFLNWALLKGYHKNTKYKSFKAPERMKDIICLYEKELFDLYNHKFDLLRHEKVRDVYCFGCFTGLRFSDLLDLKREHIIGDEIHKTIVKTREFEKIPLNKYALQLLEKYKDNLSPLPKISQQKFNKYIKEACKEVGINSLVSVTRYSGKNIITSSVHKYDLITSHTARKTFTTNSLIFGMNESVVKKITGHKKDENFKRYVKLAESYIKEQANSAWDRD